MHLSSLGNAREGLKLSKTLSAYLMLSKFPMRFHIRSWYIQLKTQTIY